MRERGTRDPGIILFATMVLVRGGWSAGAERRGPRAPPLESRESREPCVAPGPLARPRPRSRRTAPRRTPRAEPGTARRGNAAPIHVLCCNWYVSGRQCPDTCLLHLWCLTVRVEGSCAPGVSGDGLASGPLRGLNYLRTATEDIYHDRALELVAVRALVAYIFRSAFKGRLVVCRRPARFGASWPTCLEGCMSLERILLACLAALA